MEVFVRDRTIRRSVRARRATLAAVVLGAIALHARPASAQTALSSRVGLGVELNGAHALDRSNRDFFGFGAGGALRLEVNVTAPIGLEVGAGLIWVAPVGHNDTSALWFTGRAGVRVHWGTFFGLRHGDGFVDAHYNFGLSGEVMRSGLDFGVGYEANLVPSVRLGPFVRAQWGSDPRGNDPWVLLAGVSFGFLGDRVVPSTPTNRTDTDRDGVLDGDDVCPTVPAGAQPDPARRGCPAIDTDSDGVLDSLDHCPRDPAGARPDPARPGCPLVDSDADGVPDNADACPTVPAGAHPDPARRGCPLVDTDSDGVFDPEDQCPSVPQGAHPDPNRRGCPIPDRDEDRVRDEVDRCPDTPGAPSTDPARNGCPGLVRVLSSQIQILRPVYFATGRDVILETSFPVLAAVLDAYRALELQGLRVEGHSDNVGRADRNLRLSQRRADSVRRWLVAHGLNEAAVVSQGFGQQRPVEPNNTPLGRAANRRVEFHIVAAPSAAPTP